MAEDRSLLEKIVKPTDEEVEKLDKIQNLGQKAARILREEGYINFELRKLSEKALQDGISSKDIKKKLPKVRETLLKEGGAKVRILNFLYPGKGSRFDIDDQKREFEFEKQKDSKDKGKGITEQVGIPSDKYSETSLNESLAGASLSGLIKIPKGVINFGTLVYDLAKKAVGKDVPIDKSLTERFNKSFENTILGKIEGMAEEDALDTASGRITQALVQLFGAAGVAKKTAIPAVEKISQKTRQLVKSIKNKTYVKTTNNKTLSRAKDKVDKLNKGANLDKYVGITVGGGLGIGAAIMKAEDIGTIGDIDSDYTDWLPTDLDRDRKAMAGDDAYRQLMNKFKFGAELAVPIIPIVVAPFKIAKRIMKFKGDMSQSASKIDRAIDKSTRFTRSRSDKPTEVFEATQKLEGVKSSTTLTSENFVRNIDDSLRKITVNTAKLNQALEPEVLSRTIANFIMATKDGIRKNKIVFEGFNRSVVKNFTDSIKKIGGTTKDVSNLIDDAAKFRIKVAEMKNVLFEGGNINVGVKQFNDLMFERSYKYLLNDYKIFDMNMGFVTKFKPTNEIRQEVSRIFERNIRANLQRGERYIPGTAEIQVDNIIKNVSKNPITKTPQFVYSVKNVLSDAQTQVKNIADNITGAGKFKPDKKGGLIQKESDLTAFRKMFGEYKDYTNVVSKIMADMGSLVGRDQFYNTIKTASDNLAKQGLTPIVTKTYNEALVKFPYRTKSTEIITNPQGLKLPMNLAEELYTSPLDGMFTKKNWAEAFKLGDEVAGSNITKSAAYRMLVLIPKGLTNAAKTVFGPFTHTRNLTTASATTIHSGNILIPPARILEFMRQSIKSVQPQLLYRLTKNPKYRNAPKDDALYQYLLEKGVTNQSVRGRENLGLFQDIMVKEGDFISKVFASTSTALKKMSKFAQDLYIAEDDLFRIYNFLAEGYKLETAYKTAIKNGVKNLDGTAVKMPTALETMEEAARIVRLTVPNYAYVNDLIKNLRKSPLGAFASFKSEIYRTSGNSAQIALKQSRDPVLEQIGYKRMVGMAATYAVLPTMAYEIGRGLYGISREQVSAIKELFLKGGYADGDVILPVYENGKYKIINLSNGFFYDSVIRPINSMIANVDAKPDEALIPALTEGLVLAFGKELRPFIGESIWTQAVLDVFARGGLDKDGRRIYNPQDHAGEIAKDIALHVGGNLSPGSLPQFKRLIGAVMDKSINGTTFEVSDELMGFIGMRQVPLDVERKLNGKIGQFLFEQSDERKLIYAGTLSGDPVKDEDKIVKQFIFANERRLESYNQMRRYYDAARALGMSKSKIKEEFERRNQLPLFKAVSKNKFVPFTISSKMEESYEYQSKKYGVPNVLDNNTRRKIKRIIKRLKKQRLNQPYRINESDYISALPNTESPQQVATQPATNNTAPAKVTIAQPQINQQDGLTGTERAVLSPMEKEIARTT
jgi:hypothetical protein